MSLLHHLQFALFAVSTILFLTQSLFNLKIAVLMVRLMTWKSAWLHKNERLKAFIYCIQLLLISLYDDQCLINSMFPITNILTNFPTSIFITFDLNIFSC